MDLENCTRPIIEIRLCGFRGYLIIDPHTYVSGSLTVKIVRVYGGCLGTKSRRRTWTAAISRGKALNSL